VYFLLYPNIFKLAYGKKIEHNLYELFKYLQFQR